ncbi:MAG TPA: DNA polymerase I [Patescibacteria group bacterium]|nr:DNA polymerase I [Patescibacteria group bacterium]
MEKLVLVDGNALLHRAFHAMPPLTTSSGELVNAVYGFTSMLLNALSTLKPDYLIAVFDAPGPTFRHQAYTQYKATRIKAPDGLYEQLPRIKEVCRAMNIPIFELAGYEADDIIATLTRQAKSELMVVIATGDKDSYQLIDTNVRVFTPRKSFSDTVLLDEQGVIAKMGVKPVQIPDLKGLAGDPSDNIPGVRGIGDTGAAKLLQKYETIENLYEHLPELPERTQKLLAEGAEDAMLSKSLATSDDHVPVKFDIGAARLSNYNLEGVTKLFNELEFKSLLTKLPEASKTYQNIPEDQLPMFQNVPETVPQESGLGAVLRGMEEAGVLVDLKVLKKLKTVVDSKIAKLESKIYSAVGHEFNLNSPKQLAEVLFDELHLETLKKGKFGRSTAVDVLTSLKDAHPVIPHLLQYRELFKLKSTYIDALPQLIGPDGRLHTHFHDDVARSGRLSSTDPNLQNIPTRGVLGQEIRRAFVAPYGSVLLKADYNQIELRVMAHISGDPALQEVFRKGEDVHARTAAWIFHKDPAKITPDERRVAKTVNFGVLYGMSPYGLSQSLGIDPKVAAKFIERYYQRFSRVREWQEEIKKLAYQQGYLTTLGGFKRYLLELQSSSYLQRSAGERMAINLPIQGTAADIIKKAMVTLAHQLKERRLKSRIILQVHDELVMEVPNAELSEVAPLSCETMQSAFKLDVPIVVELKAGPNWADMKVVKV